MELVIQKSPPSTEFIQARLAYLFRMADNVSNKALRTACRVILSVEEFKKCTAARHKHQAYEGGLVVHTAEVLEGALAMAACRHIKVDYDVLVTAIIFHDYGKIYDYTSEEVTFFGKKLALFEYTSHQYLIRHLSRSYAEFMSRVSNGDMGYIPEDTINQIGHCILAHHGRQEWGSPTEPKTVEAYIIHFADSLSASYSLDEYPT